MEKIKIENLSDYPEDNNNDNQNPLLPKHPFRMLMPGPTKCGKTNLLKNLIFKFLDWDRLYICAKDLEEPTYAELIENFEDYSVIKEKDIMKCKKINNEAKSILLSEYQIYSEFSHFEKHMDNFIDVNELDPEFTNIVVFDDCVLNKNQDKAIEFFIRGRKKNATIIYLSQEYYNTPIKIRDNCNYMIFFQLNRKKLNQIIKEIDGTTLDATKLKEYDFYVLDKTQDEDYMRYRINFNPFLSKEKKNNLKKL